VWMSGEVTSTYNPSIEEVKEDCKSQANLD
jgi:hypothetical protein